MIGISSIFLVIVSQLPIMSLSPSTESPILVMERFNGYESYPIELAQWNLYRDEELGMMNLWIYLRAGAGIVQHEDTKYIGGKPNWELNLVKRDLSEAVIKVNFSETIPSCYDENQGGWLTNFYFCSHNGTDRNTIETIDIDGDRVRFKLLAETIDVNYYDGSKPPTQLSVDTWFDRNCSGRRSFQ
jgi:hypothetical protein